MSKNAYATRIYWCYASIHVWISHSKDALLDRHAEYEAHTHTTTVAFRSRGICCVGVLLSMG